MVLRRKIAGGYETGYSHLSRFAKGLQAGQVAVNAALGAGVIGGPFGGYKRSGFGRTPGTASRSARSRPPS